MHDFISASPSCVTGVAERVGDDGGNSEFTSRSAQDCFRTIEGIGEVVFCVLEEGV